MHLSKFAPNLAEVTQPMRELLVKAEHMDMGRCTAESI